MSMAWVLDTFTLVLLLVGGFFVIVGGIGALRMPDLYTRMHATSLTDTMGSLCILTGLMLQAPLGLITLKLAAIGLFLIFTSPVSAYALANAALLSGHEPALNDGETLRSVADSEDSAS